MDTPGTHMKSMLSKPITAMLLMVIAVLTVHTQELKVTSPRSGQILNPGDYHAITWSGISSPNTFVRLEYSTDAGDTWTLITDSAMQSDYVWRIPNVNSKWCKVRASGSSYTAIVLEGHGYYVNTGSYSNDGKLVVTASDDDIAIVWNAQSGERLQTYVGHELDVMYASFSPDDNKLLTSSFDGSAAMWDVASGRRLFIMRSTPSSAMNRSSFSPDGLLVAAACWDSTARIWNAYNGQYIKALIGHSDIVSSSFFHPRGDKIITASWDRSVMIWDIQSASAIKKISLPDKSDWAVWNPAGDRIIAACRDGNAYVFDAQTYEMKGVLSFHKSWVWSVEYSMDGRNIITSGRDGAVAIWDAQTFEKLRSLEVCATDVSAARFSPDGTAFLTTGNDWLGRIIRFQAVSAMSDSLFSIVPKVTSVDQRNTDLHLSITPNPAQDFFTINASGYSNDALVVVSDALGSKKLSCSIGELPQLRISTASLVNGTYVVSIYDGPFLYVGRVVVAR